MDRQTADAKAQLDAIYGGGDPYVVPINQLGRPGPPTRPASRSIPGSPGAMSVDAIYAEPEIIPGYEPEPQQRGEVRTPPNDTVRARPMPRQALDGSRGPLFAHTTPDDDVFLSADGSPPPSQSEPLPNALSFFEEPSTGSPLVAEPDAEGELADGDDSWNIESATNISDIANSPMAAADDEDEEDPVAPSPATKAVTKQPAKTAKKGRGKR